MYGYKPVVIFFYQVISGSKGNKVGIVSRSWYRNTSGAAHICMTHLIRQYLQLVSMELVVIP